ncbi:MAG: NYN domain-containing protein [Chloroflexi bacterium]|nr:NYN domain-containing protein [Chloroflexota bacterium]
MVILVDGHNLIPKLPSLSLNDPQDERKLIEILSEYARLSRHKVILFLDKRAIGQAFAKTVGTIKIFHADERTTADETIVHYLQKHSPKSQTMLVISSDHHVQIQAKSLGAKTQRSEEFAKTVVKLLQNPPSYKNNKAKPKMEEPLSAEEMSDWIDIFNSGPSEKYSKQ